jgi:hypothetical protein
VLADQRIIVAAPLSKVLQFDHPFVTHFFDSGRRGVERPGQSHHGE